MKKDKYSTGQFAQLCHVNKKTLFYYDQIDLFKPAILDENGYRYYTIDQLDDFSRIKALQSVGLSLTEIKEQLYSDTLIEGMQTLYSQRRAVKNKIKQLKQLENLLDQKLSELEHYIQTGVNKVFFAEYIDEYLLVDQQTAQDGFMMNYMTEGHHAGVMLQYDRTPKKLINISKFQGVREEDPYNFVKEKGKYVGIYFEAEDGHVMEGAQQAYQQILAGNYAMEDNIFLQDIAVDFINFANHLPFRLTVRLAEEK